MKVLIADDSSLNRKILKSALSANGIDVIEAETSDGVMELINLYSEIIGVIVLDIDIDSGGLGADISDEIKKTKCRDVPIIFISSYAEREDIEKGLKIGVFDYIMKPLDPHITSL